MCMLCSDVMNFYSIKFMFPSVHRQVAFIPLCFFALVPYKRPAQMRRCRGARRGVDDTTVVRHEDDVVHHVVHAHPWPYIVAPCTRWSDIPCVQAHGTYAQSIYDRHAASLYPTPYPPHYYAHYAPHPPCPPYPPHLPHPPHPPHLPPPYYHRAPSTYCP